MQAQPITQSYAGSCHAHLMGKKPPDTEFAIRMQQIMKSSVYADLTAEQVGKRWGVSPAMVSYYRSGEKLPAMRTAKRIAMDSGYCVEYLLTGRGPKRPGVPDEDGDGEHLDISQLPHGQKIHLRALVHAIQEQGSEYQKKVADD